MAGEIISSPTKTKQSSNTRDDGMHKSPLFGQVQFAALTNMEYPLFKPLGGLHVR